MNHNNTQNIQNLWCVGINYKKSDAALRGLFAINSEQYDYLLSIAPEHGLDELFIVSTCNRTEIYGFANTSAQLIDLLCTVTPGDKDTFASTAYIKNGYKAAEHLFRVAAGLDSQILGDYEILGQIKNAAKQAKAKGFIGPFMERLINSVLQASKAIKTHTALSGGTVSAAFAAVQYIREYFEGPTVTPAMRCPSTDSVFTGETVCHPNGKGSVEGRKIVVVGIGKIGRSACRNLVDYLGTRNITLINRTAETAASLAKELKLQYAPMTSLASEVRQADIVLVSTSAPEPVILEEHIAGTGEKLIIDFSIPCNVEKTVQLMPGVRFVDVDVLSKIKDETLNQRKGEVPKALTIIGGLMAEFREWCDMRKRVPMLKELKIKLRNMQLYPAAICEDADDADNEEKIQKIISSLAANMRRDNTLGCHYIQAIIEYIS